MENHNHNGINSPKLLSDNLFNNGSVEGDVLYRDSQSPKKTRWGSVLGDGVIIPWDKIQDIDTSQYLVVNDGACQKYTEFKWNDDDGYVNLSVWMTGNSDMKDDIVCKFYKNGVAISSEFTNGGSNEEFTYDNVSVTDGDTLEVWGRRTQDNSGNSYIYNFSLKYIKVLKSNG